MGGRGCGERKCRKISFQIWRVREWVEDEVKKMENGDLGELVLWSGEDFLWVEQVRSYGINKEFGLDEEFGKVFGDMQKFGTSFCGGRNLASQ